MHRDDDAIGCVALHLGNAPGGGSGSHEMISDGDSVPELGAEGSKVTGPSWCEHPDPDVKGTTRSQEQQLWCSSCSMRSIASCSAFTAFM
jgi:hypothetical protein